ncbi:MAG TPA: hypothetical protein VIR29_04760 [Anseongella sp.]
MKKAPGESRGFLRLEWMNELARAAAEDAKNRTRRRRGQVFFHLVTPPGGPGKNGANEVSNVNPDLTVSRELREKRSERSEQR